MAARMRGLREGEGERYANRDDGPDGPSSGRTTGAGSLPVGEAASRFARSHRQDLIAPVNEVVTGTGSHAHGDPGARSGVKGAKNAHRRATRGSGPVCP